MLKMIVQSSFRKTLFHQDGTKITQFGMLRYAEIAIWGERVHENSK